MNTCIIAGAAFFVLAVIILLALGIEAYNTPVTTKPWEPGDE